MPTFKWMAVPIVVGTFAWYRQQADRAELAYQRALVRKAGMQRTLDEIAGLPEARR